MKKFTITLLFLSGILFSFHSEAQWQSILSENFEEVTVPALPAGFVSSPSDTTGWVTSASNPSTYTNASAGNNLKIDNNSSAGGNKYVMFPSFSTLNMDSVTVIWGARFTKNFLSSGSTILGLQYSTDGNNWYDVTYTENPNDSNWYLDNNGKPIYLPAAVLNQANVTLRLGANIVPNPNGTYRIDDLQIEAHKKSLGTLSPSIGNSEVKSFYNASEHTLLVNLGTGDNYNVTISNILGQLITGEKNVGNKVSLDLSQVPDGIYFLSVYNASSGKMITSRFNKY